MCYRQTSHYLVLCDRCGLSGPEGPGWSTPSYADEAALEVGWEMTMTEHLCPDCARAALPDQLDEDLRGLAEARALLPPAAEHCRHPHAPPPAPALVANGRTEVSR